jgi:hypothetical protein
MIRFRTFSLSYRPSGGGSKTLNQGYPHKTFVADQTHLHTLAARKHRQDGNQPGIAEIPGLKRVARFMEHLGLQPDKFPFCLQGLPFLGWKAEQDRVMDVVPVTVH